MTAFSAPTGWEEWVAPFWDQPLELWDAMFDGGVRTHYVATALCARLLRAAPSGLVVTISAHVDAEPRAGVQRRQGGR